MEPNKKKGPRVNEEITNSEIQLISKDGENVGSISTEKALEMAYSEGLDLVEIASKDDMPVCKILDYGKYKYQAQKRAAEARKKQKIVETKEIKLRPNIEKHDYDVKLRHTREFIQKGDKVKFSLRFRGREMAHQDLGLKLLTRVKEDMSDLAKVEFEPKLEGRQMIMIIAPQ